MNIDTGQITRLDDDMTERDALLRRLLPIDLALATDKQKSEMRVSLSDHRSALGIKLTSARSIYVPHVGAKQLAKMATP